MKQVDETHAWPRLSEPLVPRRVATWVRRCGVPGVLTLMLLLVQVGAAQGAVWHGEITLTRSTETVERGVRESRRVEQRWTDFVTRRDGTLSVSFDTSWTVVESRSTSDEDCDSLGHAAGTGPYPWFLFELNPFDELNYMLYSGGTGGDGPDARGTGTRTCRYREPATFTYSVPASWLQPGHFPTPSLVDGLSKEELAALPQATLDMAREIDARQRELASVARFAVTGRIDPEHPSVIRGSVEVEITGGTAVLTWDLVRPLRCADASGVERFARETEIVRDAQPRDEEALDQSEAPYSGTPLAAADVEGALVRAIGTADHAALQAPVESGEAGGIQSFVVRVSDAGGTLPTLEHVRAMLEVTCVQEASLEGARRLIVGSVQWAGHRFRVAVRVVDVETGAILDALRVDGAGGSDDLATAIGSAFARAIAR